MKISLFQVSVRDDEAFEARLARVLGAVGEERGRDLIVLPELWPHGGFSYDGWGNGEALDGPILSAVAEAARRAGCYVHAGGIVESNPRGRPYNTAVLFGPDGRRLALYRKIHLYGFDEGEAVLFEPGTELVTADTTSCRLGLATCFDLRFPELFRGLMEAGAEVFVIPAAWPVARLPHWRLLLRARAVEDQVFVLGCATAGTHAGKTMGGHSAIIDPFGDVIAEASLEREEILRADIDLSAVRRIRKEFPVLEWRRLGMTASSTQPGANH